MNNNKLKAVIIDDEKASRESLSTYLTKYCPEVEILSLAESVKTGLEVIRKFKPELVFLDIEMPYGNAFDLLEQIDTIDFEIIFVTAYSNYAIKALNLSASYYLLKPVDIEDLIKAVQRVIEKRNNQSDTVNSMILVENIKIENKQLHQIVLPLIDGFEVIRVNEIVRCQANDNFTDFFLTNGQKRMISRTLKFYENLLNDYDFVRVHKSHLINIQHVNKYIKGKGGQVLMSSGETVDVSLNKKEAFLSRFK